MRRTLIASCLILAAVAPARAGVTVSHERELRFWPGFFDYGIASAVMDERVSAGGEVLATISLQMDPDEPWVAAEQREFRGSLYPPDGLWASTYPASDPHRPLPTDGIYIGLVRDDTGFTCPVRVQWRALSVRERGSYRAGDGASVVRERDGPGEGHIETMGDCRALLYVGSVPNVRWLERTMMEVTP